MKKQIFAPAIASAFIGAVAFSAPALADPPHCPPGHEKKGWCGDRGHNDYRDEARAYEDGYRDAVRDLRRGDRIRGDYQVIRDYDRYGLNAPRDGYYYARQDGNIVLVAAATQVIAELLD